MILPVSESIVSFIGKTPLLNIDGIYAKLEFKNPSGSIKDRMARYMIEQAEKRGDLRKGMEIVEATSGNTGIALSMISAVKGYKFTAIMPEFMSVERISMMKAFGAKVITTPTEEDVIGAVNKLKEYLKPGMWNPNQFENDDNPNTYRYSLALELIDQMDGKIDAFVAGMGTGGTVVGVARGFNDNGISARIAGIEPEESPIITQNRSGTHNIQGIGEGFIPKIVKDNMELIDEVITVSTKEAIDMALSLAKRGVFVGISSGANLVGAIKIKKKYGLKRVATVFPDSGDRYLSVYKDYF